LILYFFGCLLRLTWPLIAVNCLNSHYTDSCNLFLGVLSQSAAVNSRLMHRSKVLKYYINIAQVHVFNSVIKYVFLGQYHYSNVVFKILDSNENLVI